MATKSVKRNGKKTMKAKVKAKPRVVTNRKKQSKLAALLNSKLGLLCAGLLIGGIGMYLLSIGHADPALPKDNPARGLYYSTLHSKKDPKGPCGENFEDTSPGQSNKANSKACLHLDPGPEGVDVRVRAKQVEKQMAAQADYDKQHPQNPNTEPGAAAGDQIIANDLYGGTVSNVTGNPWPCFDTSRGGHVSLLYAYRSGNTNRLGGLRDNFEAISRRVNAITYNSSKQNGGDGRQVRFLHNADCSHLVIRAVPITGAMGDYNNVVGQLRAAGYSSTQAKFLVWVDADAGCGQGSVWADSRPTSDNYNNSGNMYALVWRGCWNYAEPHELMHTLGAVQTSAPYASPGYHCIDQHDVMCYNDGTRSPMIQRCDATVNYSRFDCGKDTYFNAATPKAGSWLSTHWNTANSRFLTRY